MTATISHFQAAVDAFRKGANLDEAEVAEFQLTDLSSLNQAINDIQNKQLQNKKLMYMRRLEPFLKTMQDYGQILEVFLNVSDFIAFVWGPMKYILLVASTFSDALNSLLEAYQQIGEQIPQLLQYEQLMRSSPHMGTVLAMIYQDILEFHREALRYFKQRSKVTISIQDLSYDGYPPLTLVLVWKRLFQATWRGFSLKVEALTNRMRQHRHLIESQATIVEFEEVQKLRKLADVEFENARNRDLDRRRLKVMQWLVPACSETIQDGCERVRSEYPETGRWLLNDGRFKAWFDPFFCSNPLLWLSGIPGAGKTVLASLAIEEARKLPDTTVVFFYCKYSDETRNSFLSIARGILSQMLNQNQSSSSLLLYIDEKASCSGEPVLTTSKLAKQLLETAFKSCKRTYVILDGLDECNRDQRKEICLWFRDLIDGLPRSDMDAIRCMFVSQDDGFARKDLSMIPSLKIALSDNKGDIEVYTSTWFRRIEEKFGSIDPQQFRVVIAKAQGMFLYARLVLDNLYEQRSRERLLEEMQRFPQGLDEAYERILDRILDSSKTIARKHDVKQLLGWIACAKRPMKWYEIQGAVSINIEDQTVDFEARKHCETSKDLCASLVEIGSDESIELVHSTAREYLIRSRHINPTQVECDLASLSIAYLTFSQIDKDKENSEIEKSLTKGYYSFYEYAVSSWVFHVEAGILQASNDHLDELAEVLGVFLEMHWTNPLTPALPSKSLQDKFRSLKNFECYDKLMQAVAFSHKRHTIDNNSLSYRDDFGLSIITSNIRTVLEGLASSLDTDKKLTLEGFYGPNWFKCPRMSCQYFYRGFQRKDHLQQHISRHERAFLCYIEGCPTNIFGCLTAKDLQDHMSDHHGVETTEDEFPKILAIAKNTQIHPSDLQCTLCPKKFTRKHNLSAHMRTHTNEKPFTCTVCALKFARVNDLNRHMGSLHGANKLFVCRGRLDDGGEWGCGQSFSRADKLSSHHKSAAGSRCLRILQEQEAEKQRKQHEEERARLKDLNSQHAEPDLTDSADHLMKQNVREQDILREADTSKLTQFQDQIRPEDTRPLLPKGGAHNVVVSTSTSPKPIDDAHSAGSVPKPAYQRPKHERVYCDECDTHKDGFRGYHELSRHRDREHRTHVKKWICVEPGQDVSEIKPLFSLSTCKSCAQQGKKYSSYYNAAAHLRRAHFHPRARDRAWPREKKTDHWPPMSELRRWMREIEEEVPKKSLAATSSFGRADGIEFVSGDTHHDLFMLSDDEASDPGLYNDVIEPTMNSAVEYPWQTAPNLGYTLGVEMGTANATSVGLDDMFGLGMGPVNATNVEHDDTFDMGMELANATYVELGDRFETSQE